MACAAVKFYASYMSSVNSVINNEKMDVTGLLGIIAQSSKSSEHVQNVRWAFMRHI